MLALQRAQRDVRKLRADVERPQVQTTAQARAQRHLDKLAKKARGRA
jgi:hypothetical protein